MENRRREIVGGFDTADPRKFSSDRFQRRLVDLLQKPDEDLSPLSPARPSLDCLRVEIHEAEVSLFADQVEQFNPQRAQYWIAVFEGAKGVEDVRPTHRAKPPWISTDLLFAIPRQVPRDGEQRRAPGRKGSQARQIPLELLSSVLAVQLQFHQEREILRVIREAQIDEALVPSYHVEQVTLGGAVQVIRNRSQGLDGLSLRRAAGQDPRQLPSETWVGPGERRDELRELRLVPRTSQRSQHTLGGALAFRHDPSLSSTSVTGTA